jgi:hypothetical protein
MPGYRIIDIKENSPVIQAYIINTALFQRGEDPFFFDTHSGIKYADSRTITHSGYHRVPIDQGQMDRLDERF